MYQSSLRTYVKQTYRQNSGQCSHPLFSGVAEDQQSSHMQIVIGIFGGQYSVEGQRGILREYGYLSYYTCRIDTFWSVHFSMEAQFGQRYRFMSTVLIPSSQFVQSFDDSHDGRVQATAYIREELFTGAGASETGKLFNRRFCTSPVDRVLFVIGYGDGDCPSIIIEIVASRMGGEGCCPLEWCGI